MKIEVGGYVRTKDGVLAKIKNEDEITTNMLDQILYKVITDCNEYYEVVVKYSKNIIDLIQEGDYVNGEYVKEIIQYESEKCIIAFIGIIGEEAIKTILTKEQYEKNSYKIGE